MTTNHRYLICVCIILCVVAIAGYESMSSNNETTLTNEALLEKAEAGDVEAVYELGKSGDQALIPKLLQMLQDAKDKKKHPVYIRALRIATVDMLSIKHLRTHLVSVATI